MPYRLISPERQSPAVKGGLIQEGSGVPGDPGGPGGPAAEVRIGARQKTLAVLPTLFTLGNLLCGFGAIFYASRPVGTPLPFGWTTLAYSAGLIFLGMVFDVLDGRIARLTRSTSDLGEQLDSMADMVTFGVAPAFLAVQLINVETPFISERHDRLFDRLVLVIACIYVACAALRLARFNVETEGPEARFHATFRGLPSPAAAGTVASLVLLHQYFFMGQLDQLPQHWSVQVTAFGMVATMFLAAFAMVSRLEYPHLANRFFRGRVGIGTAAKIVIVGLFLLLNLQGSLAVAFIAYALSAPAMAAWQKLRKLRATDA